jgi:hypothetical protein
MKFGKLFTTLLFVTAISAQVSGYAPVSQEFDIITTREATLSQILEDFYLLNKELIDTFNHYAGLNAEDDSDENYSLNKRDLTDIVENLLEKINSSQIIPDALASVSTNPSEFEMIANMLSPVLKGLGSLSSVINMNINTLQTLLELAGPLLNLTKESGVIQTTLNTLVYNDDNLYKIADFAGDFLRNPNNTWFPKLLVEIGNGKPLSFDLINDLILNTESKANGTTPSNKNVVKRSLQFEERSLLSIRSSNYSGSASEFFDNIFGTVLNGNIFSKVTGMILTALNETNFISGVALSIIDDDQAQEGITTILKVVNSTGLLDFDLNKYFVDLKNSNYLSKGVEWILTDPKFSPRLALIFERMESTGVYYDIQDNLYGPHKRDTNSTS